jgi:chorismate synthase
MPFDLGCVEAELRRRRPGQSRITTQRKEEDRPELLSGVFEGKTLGTPIALLVRNHDAKSADYEHLRGVYRPSHADYTYQAKYGHRDHRGGGRASARETVARVMAGAVARQIIPFVEIVGFVRQVQDLCTNIELGAVSLEAVESNEVRCPDAAVAAAMIERIDQTRKSGDSLGGIVECVARNVPAGLGEPVFDKLEADLAKAILSIPACKGFDVGSGFAGVAMTGSAHNDLFFYDGKRVRTRTNRSGGIQGGISNGEDIVVRAAFKPTATILRPQQSIDAHGHSVTLQGKGRHDPCVLPRAVPIVEAAMAVVLADHWLRHQRTNSAGR